MPLLVFLLKSKCFRRCFFWPHISHITAFYPPKYWQDSQLLLEAQRPSTAMWSLKGHINSKNAVDVARCRCEGHCRVLVWAANHHPCCCRVSHVPLDQSWWMATVHLSVFNYAANHCQKFPQWNVHLILLPIAFHFTIACILSITFNALLSSVNSIKLRILHLSVPAPWEKCCHVACCGVAVLMQVEGPLPQIPSALCMYVTAGGESRWRD